MSQKHLISIDSKMILKAFFGSFKMLNPFTLYKNPVMFCTFLGALLTTIYTVQEIILGSPSSFNIQITLWLIFTVIFGNFAESLAESRGKAQAESLKKAKVEAFARKYEDGVEFKIEAKALKKGDIILCQAGDIIPADGEVIEGAATVDESAITGESAPVIRESGGDRSAVTAGTTVLSDELRIRVISEVGDSFLDRMINLIEGAKRQKTPNEVALSILLFGLTIIFFIVTITLKSFFDFSLLQMKSNNVSPLTLPILISLFVCLIPTTISALLSAIGIAGMDRLVKKNVIAKSGKSIEAAGDIDLLILDKTGTITIGNRMATAFHPVSGVLEKQIAEVAQMASLADETPEGRSIVILAKNLFNERAEGLDPSLSHFVPFSAITRMSGLDIKNNQGQIVRRIRKGAGDSIKTHIESLGGNYPKEMEHATQKIAGGGGTPLVVSDNDKVLGIIELKDIVKGGIKERFLEMRKMGIKTIMVTGDNPLTAAAIAAEAGVDDYFAEATPEMKLDLIKKEQQAGRLVAMTGDGTNDAPALAQADVAVAMNTGTQASREAGNMIDLDSNPTKLLDIVEIGKQLLMTRGAITTFSIANDVAKYFAILPPLLSSLYILEGDKNGPLEIMNIMHLHSKESAILSAVIFNALIIVALIPLALKGVKYKAESKDTLLRNNILWFGFGGVIAPFIGIKVLDTLLILLRLA